MFFFSGCHSFSEIKLLYEWTYSILLNSSQMCLLSFFNRFTESAKTRMISLGFEAKSFNGLPPFHGPWQVKSLIKSVWQKSSYPNCAFLLKGWSGMAAKLLRQGFCCPTKQRRKDSWKCASSRKGEGWSTSWLFPFVPLVRPPIHLWPH